MAPRANRSAHRRGGHAITTRRKPYPACRPLNDSALVNREQSTPPSPSEPAESKSTERKQKRARRDLGLPTREEYDIVEAQYLDSLDHRKKSKALISRDMFDSILLVLHNASDQTIRTPQFRWWVRKMFKLERRGGSALLSTSDSQTAHEESSDMFVVHDGKQVAVKEDIYAILCLCHERIGHGGRDKTAAEVRQRYTWVPKELVAGFVRSCPTCIYKRT
ncbi:hypothetical protein BD414DRAFT_458081, partial [Trametes punicea]